MADSVTKKPGNSGWNEKKLSAEDAAALEQAKATIRRLEGEPPAPDPSFGPPVLKRYRVRLHRVTWDEKTKKDFDNTTKSMVHDPKTGKALEVVIDMAIVEAFNKADAWQKFCHAWGITQSDHAGSVQFAEVRNLTEDERRSPPANVLPPVDNVLVGVPAPRVLPIRADGEFNRPVPSPMAAVG